MAALFAGVLLVGACQQVSYGILDAGRDWGQSWRSFVDGRSRSHMNTLSLSMRFEAASAVYDPALHAVYPAAVDVASTKEGVGLLSEYRCLVYLDLDDDEQADPSEPAWLWERSFPEAVTSYDPGPRHLKIPRALLDEHTLRTDSVIQLAGENGFEWTDLDSRWLPWQVVDPARRLMHALTGS
ncbi:MAG: hypothetical protein DHS20C15_12390 [Planctomycetota bacterium]|nr:MAG: hypothetical protein DHS20C15_12390 [Planctomycetota bacterium]